MDKSQLEDKIQKSVGTYEIKTSAQSVLNAYAEKNPKPVPANRHKRFPWKPVVSWSTVLAGAIVLAVVLPVTLVRTSVSSSVLPVIITPQEGLKGGTRSQTAFQLSSGLNILAANGSDHLKSRLNATERASGFSAVVDAFDNSLDHLEAFLYSKIEVDNLIYQGRFAGQYGTYDYQMIFEVDGQKTVFYTDMSFEEDDDETEKTYKGEIIVDDADNYKVKIVDEYDAEDDEREIETTITGAMFQLEIAQESEATEKEYSYLLKVDGRKYYEEKFDFEKSDKEKDDENDDPPSESTAGFEVEIFKDGRSFIYESLTVNSKSYRLKYESPELEGVMEILKETNVRRYTDEKTGQVIEKN